MLSRLLFISSILMALFSNSGHAGPDHQCAPLSDKTLRILDKEESEKSLTIEGPKGPITLGRVMTVCAKNEGWLQPLVPSPGIVPVTEIEVIDAISNPDILLVDMRTQEWYIERTIPGAVNIPYTEVAMRLDELGCEKTESGWDCKNAVTMLGFCNGPVCPQSPSAMKAMIRDGFPAEKIMYYRGGMLDWDALGLTTVQGEL